MKKLILASNNKDKLKEIREILKDIDIEIFSLKDMKIDIDIEEDGITFIDNAYKKAKTIFDILNNKEEYMVLADDSGLCVDALGGEPGVYSARFAGEHGNSKKNNEKLLKLMKEENNRRAKFICAMVLVISDDTIIKVQGQVQGIIGYDNKGTNGFGYDPLFYVPELKKTFGEVNSKEKNLISHRSRALNKLKTELIKYIQEA